MFLFGRLNQLDDPFLNLHVLGEVQLNRWTAMIPLQSQDEEVRKSSQEDSEAIWVLLQVGLQFARSSQSGPGNKW